MGKPHKKQTTPFACFECRKSFKRHQEPGVFERPCPVCGGVAYRLFQKFKAPRSTAVKQWKVVEFLYNHGFWFQSVYSRGISSGSVVRYPHTLDDARSFVRKFKEQAVSREMLTW